MLPRSTSRLLLAPCLLLATACLTANPNPDAAGSTGRPPAGSTEGRTPCHWTDSLVAEGLVQCNALTIAKGLSCYQYDGSDCGRKNLYCCPYPGPPDVEQQSWVYLVETDRISEEFPRYYALGRQRLGFLRGLSCSDNACDDITTIYLETPELVRLNRRCSLTEVIAGGDHDGVASTAICPDDQWVAGLICTGSRCEHLQLYCCDALYRDLNPRDGREGRDDGREGRETIPLPRETTGTSRG